MLRVALLVDGWNILKAADRLKRRINFGELPRAVTNANGNKSREIVFQRFYIGPVSGRNAPDRIARIADEVKAFGYEWIQCVTENTRLKTDVDSHIKMDMLQWAYCHSVDLIALCSGDGGYTEAIRRVKVLGLRVEVYTVKASNHIAPALERNVHAILDLEAIGVLQQGDGHSMADLFEDGYADGPSSQQVERNRASTKRRDGRSGNDTRFADKLFDPTV